MLAQRDHVSLSLLRCRATYNPSDPVSDQEPRNSDVGRSEYSSPQSRRPPFLLVLRPPSSRPSPLLFIGFACGRCRPAPPSTPTPRLSRPPMSPSLPPLLLLFLARFILLGFHLGASKSSPKPLLLFACGSPFKYLNSFSPPLALALYLGFDLPLRPSLPFILFLAPRLGPSSLPLALSDSESNPSPTQSFLGAFHLPAPFLVPSSLLPLLALHFGSERPRTTSDSEKEPAPVLPLCLTWLPAVVFKPVHLPLACFLGLALVLLSCHLCSR